MLLEKRKLRQRRKVKLKNYQNLPRLMVFRSEKHIYGQVVDLSGKVLVHMGSNNKTISWNETIKSHNVLGAQLVGEQLGLRAKEHGISKLVFDRSGYKFHGRIKAFADAVRKNVEI
jgi:large subunit ribosomal protein L18